ncbi:MAG TPA: hypothetical protein VKM56_11510 [Verrucomicrobiae bacterium]|nr:hypothetical protein [Verrucomicrobiae bacterium]
MKTFLTAVLACAICSTAALAGQPPSTAGTKPPGQNLTLTPQAPGAVGIPGLDIKKKGIASVGTSGSVYRSAADSIPPLVIQFSSTNQNVIQEWEEDLTVMTRLIEEALQRAADEDLTDVPFKLGIPITLVTANRSVRPLFLEGFGALFMIKVNFPVVPPSKIDEEKPEHPESDWDKARQEIFGRQRQLSWLGGTVESGADYDSDQVETLTKELTEVLKNAANFRNLRPDEYVSITVFGSPNSGAKTVKAKSRKKSEQSDVIKELDRTIKEVQELVQNRPARPGTVQNRPARPGTVLTMRVRKGDVDAFSKGTINYDAFAKKVATNTYLGSGYGITSLNSWIQSTIRQFGGGR